MSNKKDSEPMSDQFLNEADKTIDKKPLFRKCLTSAVVGFLVGVIVTCLVWLLMIDTFVK